MRRARCRPSENSSFRTLAGLLVCLVLLALVAPVWAQPTPVPPAQDGQPQPSQQQLEEDSADLGQTGEIQVPPPPVTPTQTVRELNAHPGPTIGSPDTFRNSRVLDALEQSRVQRQQRQTQELERFGSSFFERSQEELTRADEATVPDDYKLRSGDELNVTTYNIRGGESVDISRVDESGVVQLTGVGPVPVAGLTRPQAETRFNSLISRQFPNMRVRLTFTRVPKIRVFVLGEANRPGGYLMNPTATVLDALLHARGPSRAGSYRRIELQRAGRTVATFDLYDLLIFGRTASPRLQNGDRIFVPLVGNEVSITGEVLRPAVYELRQEKTLAQLISLAGGLRPEAYSPRVQIERIDDHNLRKLIDIPFDKAATTALRPGDFIIIEPVLENLTNGVFVSGAVERPGFYEIKTGASTVAGVIRQAQGLTNGAYAQHAEIFRYVRTFGPHGETLIDRSAPQEVIGFDLAAALSGDSTNDLALLPEDVIVVSTREEALVDRERVRIQGEVKNPGEYPRFGKMRVRDLVNLAGGITPEASVQAEIARPGPMGKIEFIPVDLGGAMEGGTLANNPVLQDLDVLIVRPQLRAKRWPASITLLGEFKHPGVYVVDPDRETLADVIARAGGLTAEAYPKAAVLTRRRPEILSTDQSGLAAIVFKNLQEVARQIALVENARLSRQPTAAGAARVDFRALTEAATAPPRELDFVLTSGRIPISLGEILASGQGDPRVKEGDVLFVPQEPEMVIVSGAVVMPTPLVWRPGRHAEEYIDQAGGFAEDAATDRVLILRVSGQLVKEGDAGVLEPGDLILVPPRALISEPDAFERFLSVLQVIANGAFVWRAFR